MATFVFGMNVSLDGYVDHQSMRTGPALFRHWIDHLATVSGSIYGRRMYDIMRYWDDDHPEWKAEHREFAVAWRKIPKWVVSRTLDKVGPNATLIAQAGEATIRDLKKKLTGDVTVSGPTIAGWATGLGLIDEYRLYYQGTVLGKGTPFFAGPRPPLRLISADKIGDDTMRLIYRPA